MPTRALSDDSKIPLKWLFAVMGVCVACMGSAIGVGAWVSKTGEKVENLETKTKGFDESFSQVSTQLTEINKSLARIEGRLESRGRRHE